MSIPGGKGTSAGLACLLLWAGGMLAWPLSIILEETRGEAIEEVSPQSFARAFLGGTAKLAADFAWIHGFSCWMERDEQGTLRGFRLATILDPQNAFFWRNGARFLALDLPHWRAEVMRQEGKATPENLRRMRIELSRQALRFLEEARLAIPHDPWLPIEQAMIAYQGMNDKALAAHYYYEAAILPGSPYFAARLHGELLRQIGREAEALAWYQEILPSLPPNDPEAFRNVVLQRIEDLESHLEE